MSKAIREDEWEAELQRVGLIGQDDPGESISELATRFGLARGTIHGQVAKGLAEGRYVMGWARRIDNNGRRIRVRVYRATA